MAGSGGVFFILGAGASADSGLPTYRGPEGIYKDMNEPTGVLNKITVHSDPLKIWAFLKPFYEQCEKMVPGPTYQKIKEISSKVPYSFALTQNIDQLIRTIVPYTEVHGSYGYMKCMKCGIKHTINLENLNCPKCKIICRPDVVLFGEKIPEDKIKYVHTMLNKNRYDYVIIVGTTMQFPYLRIFVNEAKHRGSKVIHINPDDSYDNVTKNEIWIKKSAAEGLQEFMDTYLPKIPKEEK